MTCLRLVVITWASAGCLFGDGAHAVVQYTLTDLGTLGGTQSGALAINNHGEIVGYSTTKDGSWHAFLYSGAGPMQDLGTNGGNQSQANDISDNGQIVGSGLNSNGTIGSYGGHGAEGLAINNYGQVVGTENNHGFLWSPPNAFQDLGAPWGGLLSVAHDVNNEGVVVGFADTAIGSLAFRYSGAGPMQPLGTLGGTFSSAAAINDSGQIVGTASLSSGIKHAFLYSEGGPMKDLGHLGGGYSAAYAINNSGMIVGYSDSRNGWMHACLWGDSGIQDLNNMIDSSLAWTLTEAFDINDSGQIVGRGHPGDGSTHAFLLTPVPEPATLTLLATGGLAVLRRKRGAT